MDPLPILIAVRGIVAVTAFGLAVLAFRARPGAIENRLLAALLMLLGATMATTPVRHLFPMSFEREMWSGVLFRALPLASLGIMLALVGTMGAPLARPFATWAGRFVALGMTGLILAWALLFPGWMISMQPTPEGWTVVYVPGVAFAIAIGTALAGLYVAFVGVQAMWRAPRASLERAHAATVLVAILLLSGPAALNASGMIVLEAIDPGLHAAYMQTVFPFYGIVYTLLVLLAICALSWGMLRTQLYEVDLRVKWTLRRGTVGAVFIAAFLVVAQLVQGFFSTELGWAAGGLVAGLLLFALRPIERFAERFADAAMPRVRDTPEWREERRIEIYRTAVRLALADSKISREEERELANLATQLGLDPRQALDVRTQVEDDTSLAASA